MNARYLVATISKDEAAATGECRSAADVKDMVRRNMQIMTFEEACNVKGLSPKNVLRKPSRIPACQRDRISTDYPTKDYVSSLFPKGTKFEDDNMPSSQKATAAYIEKMYGIKAKITPNGITY